MPRDLDLDYELQDGEQLRERPKRQAPQDRPQSRPPQRNGVNAARRKKNQTTSIIILSVEVIVFIALICLFFVLKSKIDKADGSASEGGAQVSEEGGEAQSQTTSNGVNVESPDFSLTCSKVQLAKDNDDNPVGLIYFTFVNKTDNALSMSAVFPPSLTQNGAACPDATNLAEVPAEVANRDMAVSGGQSVECCYGFVLQDLTSPITLSIYDNYTTFAELGSTTINLQ